MTRGPDVAISIIVMFNLAIARPVLDLLGGNPEFFIAHELTGGDAVVLGILLTVVVPSALGGVAWLAFAVRRRMGSSIHVVVFSLLTACLAVQVLKALESGATTKGLLLIAIAIVLGALAAAFFHRSSGFRSFLRMGMFVPFLVLAVFVFASSTSALISPSAPARATTVPITKPVPIVFVVMDELPLASLLDEDGDIEARLFPNFARLTRTFTWFRNATTVHNMTTHAVPALLDGRLPVRGNLPVVNDHPENLFTFLADEYRLRVQEQITDLCPVGLCEDIGPSMSAAERWSAGGSDLRVVLAHMLLPSDLAESLPPVDETWAGFDNRKTLAESTFDPLADFEDFLGALESGDTRQMYFLHLMLPHLPWRYLPMGQTYPETASPLAGFVVRQDGSKRWSDDKWLVQQAYQRYLLQAAFVDTLIGRLIGRLREVGLYGRSMIVLTSDHGAVFRPGFGKRTVNRETVGEVAAVPLFVKLPSQRTGGIDDRAAQSIDIFPTIAEQLGVRKLSGPDGKSLIDPVPQSSVKRYIFTRGRKVRIRNTFTQALRAGRHKYRLFDIDRGPDGLFEFGPGRTKRLIGRPVNRLSVGDRFDGTASIRNLSMYRNVQTRSSELPAMLSGRITAEPDTRWPLEIAVGLNGRVWGMTRTFEENDESGSFYAVLPPSGFVDGENRLQLFVVTRGEPGVSLSPVTVEGDR